MTRRRHDALELVQEVATPSPEENVFERTVLSWYQHGRRQNPLRSLFPILSQCRTNMALGLLATAGGLWWAWDSWVVGSANLAEFGLMMMGLGILQFLYGFWGRSALRKRACWLAAKVRRR
jgi:hypothetical protein